MVLVRTLEGGGLSSEKGLKQFRRLNGLGGLGSLGARGTVLF